VGKINPALTFREHKGRRRIDRLVRKGRRKGENSLEGSSGGHALEAGGKKRRPTRKNFSHLSPRGGGRHSAQTHLWMEENAQLARSPPLAWCPRLLVKGGGGRVNSEKSPSPGGNLGELEKKRKKKNTPPQIPTGKKKNASRLQNKNTEGEKSLTEWVVGRGKSASQLSTSVLGERGRGRFFH